MEGRHELGPNGKHILIPVIRQRGAQRVIEDIDLLYHQYGIRYLFWVEGTWNFNNDWLNEFCDEMLKHNFKGLGWWAFTRADKLLEQEQLGILSKMVKVGLRHVLIGGERPVDEELEQIGKTKLRADALMNASHLLKRKYPQVFRMATWLTGIRSETPESMMRLSDYTIRAKLDFTQMHPLMPFPGTPLYEEALQKGWIDEPDFGMYDMFHPVMRGEYMTAEEISHYTAMIQLRFVRKQPLRFLAGLLSPYKIRRRIKRYLMLSVLKLLARDVYLSLKGEKKFEGFGAVGKLWKPKWYDA
jgi:anaerobic magnesium-protoporphyrin IX monomethyl ester cyclase